MIINEGYWNYYMAFQVRSHADILKCMQEGRYSEFLIASYMAGDIVFNVHYEEPENKQLKLFVDGMIPVLGGTGEAITAVFGDAINERTTISLMSPIKMRSVNGSETFCPIFMFLLNTGLGVLKLRVPLIEFPVERFQAMPLQKWYKEVTVARETENQSVKVQMEKENDTVDDIVALMRHIIQNTFKGHLISADKNLCYESLVLSKTSKPNILNKSFTQDELREVYHICYPENSLEFPNATKVREFWDNEHKDIGGIDFVTGVPARLLIFSDVDKLLKAHNRTDCNNSLEYLENSMQFSYDWSICVALWKKLNEMNLFNASDGNYHKVNFNNAVYNLRENELDAMLDLCPYNSQLVFGLVFENMGLSMNPFSNRVDRLLKLEQYAKERLEEKRNLIFEVIAFVITAIFGLPAIRETLYILRNTFWKPGIDLISWMSVDGAGVLVWILIIISFIYRLLKNTIQYKAYKL